MFYFTTWKRKTFQSKINQCDNENIKLKCVDDLYMHSVPAIFFFFRLFIAAFAAYGSSSARGQIEVAAEALHHSNTGSKPHL